MQIASLHACTCQAAQMRQHVAHLHLTKLLLQGSGVSRCLGDGGDSQSPLSLRGSAALRPIASHADVAVTAAAVAGLWVP